MGYTLTMQRMLILARSSSALGEFPLKEDLEEQPNRKTAYEDSTLLFFSLIVFAINDSRKA
jgi:hypothetical protein